MENYQRDIPTKLYFGKDVIKDLAKELDKFGKNVLLTYGGGSIKKIGLYQKVIDILKENQFNVFELSNIEPNPRIESVEKGVEICKKEKIDVILAVGGGSTIDCSKAIACGVFYKGKNLWNMVKDSSSVRYKGLPLVDILTLSATGTEYDNCAVISNLKTNEKIGAVFVFPSVSFCDPTYTFSVSPYQTAAGSADIMSHIFECYFSRTNDCDLSDGISESILKSVIKNCPIALKDPTNYSARSNLMTNSSIACSGIPSYGLVASGWACHALEHELSAYYDITHGVGLAILTPRWMSYILKKDRSVAPRMAQFARNVFNIKGIDDVKVAKKGIKALYEYFQSTGIPMSLTELNIDNKNFRKMALHISKSGRLDNAYVPLKTKDIIKIYKACL